MKSIVSGCCDTNRDIFKTNAILVKKYMYIYDVKSSKILRKAQIPEFLGLDVKQIDDSVRERQSRSLFFVSLIAICTAIIHLATTKERLVIGGEDVDDSRD